MESTLPKSQWEAWNRLKDTPVLYSQDPYWSDHPRWLFSCSLYIPAWPAPAPPTPTHGTDFPTHFPQTLADDCSIFRSEPSTMLVKEVGGSWPSVGFHSNWEVNLISIPLYVLIFLLPHLQPGSITSVMFCPTGHHTWWGVRQYLASDMEVHPIH